MDYNLLEEKWIPVLWKDGHSSRVGIIEALTQAGRIRQIAASNPMDRLAILRFLLALLYWCKGNPPDDKDSISSFPPDWFKKLDENKDCFNLLGEGKRFYQRNLWQKGKTFRQLPYARGAHRHKLLAFPAFDRQKKWPVSGLLRHGVVAAAAVCYIRGTRQAAGHQ